MANNERLEMAVRGSGSRKGRGGDGYQGSGPRPLSTLPLNES